MKLFPLSILLAATAAPAFAQQAPAPTTRAAAPAETPICTDRPTKVFVTCTAPAGTVQLETDLVNWTHTSLGGVDTDVILYTNPTLKFGLSDRADLELNMVPYQEVRTQVAGTTTTISGVGDLFVRLKDRLTPDSSKVQVGLVPYVKIPTAKRGLGNREVEGGLAVPIGVSLPGGFSLATAPEIDVLLNASGSGRHVNFQNEINIGKSFGKATIYAELWGDWNDDPAGTVRQYSADFAVAYLVHPRLQLDAGTNIGLNRNTPDVQLYVGVSTRF